MARKIAIENSREHLSKNVALLLVRRCMAYWVVPNVMIARIDAKTARPRDVREERPPQITYIPDTLPPVELPDVRFEASEASIRRRLEAQTPQFRYLSWPEQQRNLMCESRPLEKTIDRECKTLALPLRADFDSEAAWLEAVRKVMHGG
jgi:hypothetical protein